MHARSRRAGARHRRRLKVLSGHGPSFTVDVGGGGFCTQSLRVLPPGTAVEGTIQVNGQEVPFAGRVTWAKAGEPRMNLKGKMGVLLTRVAAEYHDLVARLGREHDAGSPPLASSRPAR
jgi:hypothetical protein